ncbi:MAG: response regulator transcription factor [Acidobacteriota bacterium]
MSGTILIVEDDRHVRGMTSYLLDSEGYRCIGVSSAEEALERLTDEAPALILLDLALPGMNGYEFCERLKASDAWKSIPIIMLTEKSGVSDIARGLQSYADDYIPKPFHPHILVARVEALLRRIGGQAKQPDSAAGAQSGDLRIDPDTREVFVEGRPVELQKMEFDILWLLVSHPQRVHPRERIIREIRGEDYFISERVVDNHICKLRKRLGAVGDRIETVPGVGYRFRS